MIIEQAVFELRPSQFILESYGFLGSHQALTIHDVTVPHPVDAWVKDLVVGKSFGGVSASLDGNKPMQVLVIDVLPAMLYDAPRWLKKRFTTRQVTCIQGFSTNVWPLRELSSAEVDRFLIKIGSTHSLVE